MAQKPKAHNPTLSNIGPERMIKLQRMALEIVGKPSVSALVRHIADYGYVRSGHSRASDELVVEAIGK